MTILLVEPDRLIASNLIELFKRRGHRVSWVSTAQTAIHAADKKTPGAVILEPQLALHGGIEFMHEFRSYPEWETIPVILFSGLRLGERHIWQGLGISKFFYKPTTSLKTLAEVIEQLPVRM